MSIFWGWEKMIPLETFGRVWTQQSIFLHETASFDVQIVKIGLAVFCWRRIHETGKIKKKRKNRRQSYMLPLHGQSLIHPMAIKFRLRGTHERDQLCTF
jgi:hypothetical protein